MTGEKVLLDCDPGHDDVMAILTAARYADLVGITTVAGNAALEHTTRNALVTCDLAGIDVPVHSGAAGPLSGPTHDAVHVHGNEGLDGVEIPRPVRTTAGADAAGFIVETTARTPSLWIVAVGPLTNIALALRQDPALTQRVAGISIMGGGTFGNATAAAEFNIWADPEAADIVFGSSAPIRMCGLDLTHQVCADGEFIAWIEQLRTPLSAFVAALLDHYAQRILELVGEDLAALHDPCSVLAVTHPQLFGFGNHRVRIELDGAHTRGMTVIDRRVARGPVEVAWNVESAAVLELIRQAVASA
ncbi:MAG: Ribosylpyrimidine nucleosidase [Actinomycetia bacterium]|jgi:inosine-uridine nucleoside N-ribohydrolase|nr:Ribosylpyrimidine nucleosidase [Actinomycetes bacterium]